MMRSPLSSRSGHFCSDVRQGYWEIILESKDPVRLKRLRYRSWHRGFKEMDLILGHFADSELQNLNDAELDEYESLIDEPDRELYKWMTGEEVVPSRIDTALFRRIAAFGHLPRP